MGVDVMSAQYDINANDDGFHPYLYATAMHWSITQIHGSMELHPNNLRERILSVVVLLLGIIAFSSLVSSITDMMIQLRTMTNKKNQQRLAMRIYLRTHDISVQLSARVKFFIEHRFSSEPQKDF